MLDFSKEGMKTTEECINNLLLFCDDFEEAIICRNLQGVVTSFNKGAERLYGYTKEEVIGKFTTNYIPKESEKEFNDISNKIYSGSKKENYETLRIKKNGEFITVSITVYPITHDKKIVGRVAISRAVIDKEIYKLAIKGGNFGVWDRNIKTNTIYYSNRCLEMLGYNNSEISSNANEWQERIHKDDIDYVLDKINRHYKGEEYDTEYRLKCKNGNYKWVRVRGKVIKCDDEGNPLRMTGTITDINEEMLIRIKNEENENRLKWLYDSLSVGIAHGEIILDNFGDPIGYKYLNMNNYMKEVIGIQPEEFYKEVIQKLLPMTGKNWLHIFAQSVTTGKSFVFEYYNENVDKYFKINIYSPNSKQFVLLVTDITENKKKEMELNQKYGELQSVYEELSITEEELRDNYKELEKANESVETANKAKSQFLANMSHELRTPLNGILGCTQLLKFSKLSYEQNEDVLMIEESSNHLLELINDILNLSKIESGKVELKCKRFNFMEQMEFVIKDLTLLAKDKDLEILYYIDPFINKEFIGDNFRLKQVLNNLISNAVKFTEHGHIFFKVKQISKNIDETKLEFKVEDTGKGIKEDFKINIFDKFAQEESNYTKNYGGTGLGLAISKELAQMMGGDIVFESEVGKGSKFYFTVVFKNITYEDYNINNKNVHSNKENIEDKTILVVEDNDINLKIAVAFLKQLKYKCVISHNGQEAIDYLEENKVDIILMDVQMPILDGCDATKIIRNKESKTGEHIIIIAMTAYAMDGDRKKFIDCGMDDYISKPFNIETLGEILEKY